MLAGLWKRIMKRDEGAKSAIALVEKLLSLQLILGHEHARDAFPKLMTNKVAAGYVFGFHDSCFQIFGLVNPSDRAAGSALLEAGYKHIFGDQAGFTLLDSSLRWQTDREFQIGRQSGGEDFAGFKWKGTPPLGLQGIINLGFSAAMVERTLKKNLESATSASSSDNTTRIGRRGICMLCGTIKSGSYVPCEDCGFQPTSDEDLAIATMLNEASIQNFDQIARGIKSGETPEFKDKDIEKFIRTSPEVRRMLGLQQALYYTRAKTESLLTYSVQVAAQGMSETIAKSLPGEIKGLSQERMLAVLGGMMQGELIRLAPMSEKDFIKRFFGKRLVLMSMQSRFAALTGTSKDEFARRLAQAILDFEAKAFNVGSDKKTLERTIISFVLPSARSVRDYMMRSHGDPHLGSYLRILAGF
jgi:hypothetical protein